MPIRLALLFSLLPFKARACELALLLALDISGSVDPVEYSIQRDGLALALNDGLVAEALVKAEAKVSVLQWTGSTRQQVTIPWTHIKSFQDLQDLAQTVATDARVWRNFSTAIGEAMEVGLTHFQQVKCKRMVMDISGDGVSNEGIEPSDVQRRMRAAGIVVNGLVIEGSEHDLTGYFWENVITGEGAFVVTANSFEDYPARIREKLIREIVPQLTELESDSPKVVHFVITQE